MTDYSEWKVIAWRFGRTFLAVFLASFGVGLLGAKDFDALQTLFVASVGAGIVAVAKAIRGEETEGLRGKFPL